MGKHGKQAKGARFNRKMIVKDATLRANTPKRRCRVNRQVAKVDAGKVMVTISGNISDVKKFWHWRR